MAVDALAFLGGLASGDLTTTDYVVQVQYYVRDGSGTRHSTSCLATIARGTESVVINRAIRPVADDIFSQFSLTVDPNHIYFPFPALLNF